MSRGFGVGSDFTWNVQAVLGSKTSVFGWPITLALGYRALYQDYDDEDFEWDELRCPNGARSRAAARLAHAR
jgi:hypothetical protein